MSNGLGTAFGALLVIAVLLGLAVLLALSLVGVLVFRRRNDHVPRFLRYLSVALLAGVVGTAGFGVLALYDEGPVVAGLFLAVVFFPLAGVVATLREKSGLRRLDVLATAGLAWCLPFVLGLGLFFGLNAGIGSAFDLAPAEFERLRVAWVAATASGVAALLGAIWIGGRVWRSLSTVPAD